MSSSPSVIRRARSRCGDIWSGTLGRVRGIKEGDTPSFLALVPNGLGDAEQPRLGSWGGRFEGEGGRLVDVPDLAPRGSIARAASDRSFAERDTFAAAR